MKAYINTKELEWEVESLNSKDLWNMDELVAIIYTLEDKIKEQKEEIFKLNEEIGNIRENTRPLTEYERVGMTPYDFM